VTLFTHPLPHVGTEERDKDFPGAPPEATHLVMGKLSAFKHKAFRPAKHFYSVKYIEWEKEANLERRRCAAFQELRGDLNTDFGPHPTEDGLEGDENDQPFYDPKLKDRSARPHVWRVPGYHDRFFKWGDPETGPAYWIYEVFLGATPEEDRTAEERMDLGYTPPTPPIIEEGSDGDSLPVSSPRSGSRDASYDPTSSASSGSVRYMYPPSHSSGEARQRSVS